MGFFSWTTADTNESVSNTFAERPTRTVYLLQPNGEQPIRERNYEGYGVFGGIDVHDWLAERNAESLGLDVNEMDIEARRMVGIALSVGTCLKDERTGDIWHVFHDARSVVPGHYFPDTYGEVIPALGAPANQLIASGRLTVQMIKDVVKAPYPLKFSFLAEARYEDLPESDICPYQGYFYD